MWSLNCLRESCLILCIFSNTVLAAPFSLNSDSALKYALEPLNKSDFGDFGVLIVSSAGDELNLTFESGFTLSSDLKFIRLDLINGQFGNSFSSNVFLANAFYSTLLAAGGGEGDSYLIAQVSAPNLIANTTQFTLESNKFYITDINKPLSVRYRLYDSAAAAVNQGSILVDSITELAGVETGLGTSFVESFTQRTGFSNDFLRFIPSFRSPSAFSLGDSSKTLASLAKFQATRLILNDVRLASTSELITDFRVLLPNINAAHNIVSITGDFSSIKAFLNEDDDCVGATYDLVEYTSEREVKLSLNTLDDYPVFCVAAESNDVVVKRTAYQLEFGIGSNGSLFGEIVYDAATVNLPYITTYSGYRQRILLVNHAGYAVNYKTEFTAESNVAGNFTRGNYAEGVIPANSTLKLNAQDLVTINSGSTTRVSARVLIDAKPEDISAAVQILSLDNNLPPITNVLQVIEY